MAAEAQALNHVSVTAIAWSQTAENGLCRAIPNPAIMQIVRKEVQDRVSTLWECTDTQGHHAFCVTRVDTNPRELVVIAIQGSGAHVFAPLFIHMADKAGIPLRCHVVSPVLERLWRKYGMRSEETIMRSNPNEQRRKGF